MTPRPQRIQRFAAGLRFDTVAHYHCVNGRWRALPLGNLLQGELASSLAAQQAVALLTGRWPHAMRGNADGPPEGRLQPPLQLQLLFLLPIPIQKRQRERVERERLIVCF